MGGLRFTSLVLWTLITAFALSGCVSAKPSIKRNYVPEMTFAHIQPVSVAVAAVDVENDYDPSSDGRDVSSSFPTPPDIALKRYIERRLQPSGETGILKVLIEGAQIYHRYIEPDSGFKKWMGVGGYDRYDVVMKLRLYVDNQDTENEKPAGRPHSILTLERYISIPEDVSLAEREMAQLEFLERLMQDVDIAVMASLEQTLKVRVH